MLNFIYQFEFLKCLHNVKSPQKVWIVFWIYVKVISELLLSFLYYFLLIYISA